MKGTKTPSKLSDSVHHQLNMYGLAASAAGVGVLALTQPADAKIVYTKTDQVIGLGQHYDLDLNQDGITDFKLVNYNVIFYFSSIHGQSAAQIDSGGNSAAAYVSAHYSVILDSVLNAGERIANGRRFHGVAGQLILIANDGYRSGLWYNVKNGYLGLKFQIKGKIHYGWARLSVMGTFPLMTVALTGYAYETIPNKGIIAGQTKGPDVITEQPGSLGRLAQGSARLASRRRRQSASNTH